MKELSHAALCYRFKWHSLTQGHLAVTQDPTTMLISWTTKNSANPTVKWGLVSGQYTGSNTGKFSQSRLCVVKSVQPRFVGTGCERVLAHIGPHRFDR